MKSFEERMEILDEALSKETPETLAKKLGIPDFLYETWESGGKTFEVQRRIVSAANRFVIDGETIIIPAARHYSAGMVKMVMFLKSKGLKVPVAVGENQGFIDQYDNYWTREQALEIAAHAGQIGVVREKCFPEDELFSEDLY